MALPVLGREFGEMWWGGHVERGSCLRERLYPLWPPLHSGEVDAADDTNVGVEHHAPGEDEIFPLR